MGEARPPQYRQGFREAGKYAVEWLHDRAKSMNDPNAEAILNVAAFDLGRLMKEKAADD